MPLLWYRVKAMFFIDLDVKINENVNNMGVKITLYLLSPLLLLQTRVEWGWSRFSTQMSGIFSELFVIILHTSIQILL
jgi:hypothetical protein